MVIIVVAFAKADERDQPAVAAAVLRAVGLPADHMAEGIEGEGRIEDHEHPKQPGHEKPTDAAPKGTMPPESDTERDDKAGSDDRPVVLVLPENHRVSAQPNFIFTEAVRRIVEEPAAVAVPESSGRIIGIFIRVCASMMADMVRTPDQRRVL